MSFLHCSKCSGSGRVRYVTNGIRWTWECEKCRGRGVGWGPDALFLLGIVVMATGYLWCVSGCPHSAAEFARKVLQ